MRDFPIAVAMGLGATLLMDAWNLLLKRRFGIPSLDYCLLGRWFRHMTSGTFAHAHIAKSPSMRGECPVGYLAHTSIGIALALGFVAVAPDGWLEGPSPAPALLYGIGTVLFPFLVMAVP